MARLVLRSRWVSVVLFVALLVSLAFHVARIARGPEPVHVVALERIGSETSPAIQVDFDAPMAAEAATSTLLASELVGLEPAVPVEARFVTARRLVIAPTQPLAPLSTYRVRLGAALCALDGRPVARAGGASLAFDTSVLGLAKDPLASLDGEGRPALDLALTGSVAEAPLRAHLRLLDAATGTELAFVLGGSDRDWSVTAERVPDAGATLVVAAGLPPRERGNPLAREIRRDVRWSKDLRLLEVTASESEERTRLSLRFSHPLATQDLRGLVVASPSPAGTEVRAVDGGVALVGAFEPGQVVVVVAKAGLHTASGLRLERDVRRTVLVPATEPSVEFARPGTFLSAAAVPEIEIRGVNVPEVVLTMRRIHANNLVPFALDWGRRGDLAGEPVVRRVPIEARTNERWKKTLDLAALLGERPLGVWQISVADPRAYAWWASRTVLEVSDLAPVVRVRPEGVAVFVTRLSDGAAVAGAKVTAWTKANQAAVLGRTDEAGLFLARGFAGAVQVVTVETPDDLVFVDLDDHGYAHASRDVEGREPVRGAEAWVRAERGLVRPGETVRLDALLRTPAGDAPPEGLPVVWTLRGPDGRTWKRFELRASATGFLDLDVALPTDARTGAWSAEVTTPGAEATLGRTAFRVEAFVPDRLEAKVEPPAGDLVPGSRAPVLVEAHLLTGDPAEGRTARLTVRYETVDDAPIEGFTFGIDDDAPRPFVSDPIEAPLDAAGRARLEVAVPQAPPSGATLRADLDLEVIDVSGRASFAHATARLRPATPRLGVAARPDGAPAVDVALVGGAAAPATAVLERLTWHGGYVIEHKTFVWRSERIAQVVESVSVPVADGRGRATFAEPGDGAYRVRVTAPGCAPAAVRFDRTECRWRAPSADGGAPYLVLTRPEGAAVPGKDVRVACDAPFAGRGLLTLEGVGVLVAREVDVAAGAQRFDVSIPEDAPASVHVSLTLLRGLKAAAGGPVRLVGALAIPVERAGRRLAVALDAPDTVVPETTLSVTITTDAPAEVRLHLVDVGVLRLSRHPDPDPAGFFAAVRRLETRLADPYARLLAGARFAPSDAEPGGDADGAVVGPRLDPTARATIETVSLASRRVLVDGPTRVTFDVPAYEGRLRLVAVAASRAGTGAAAKDVIVKGPLSVAVHVPRAVSPGDEFTVGLEVRGDRVETEIALDGLERVGDGLPLRVRALDRLGVASVAVTAHDAKGHRVVRTARLSVRPPAPFTVLHEVRALAAGERFDGALPGDFVASTRRARVSVGSASALPYLPALDRLLEYPHGCVEQTTSRAFPLLAWSELARLAEGEGGEALGVLDTVDAAVDRLLSMQTSTGGFGFWPGDSFSAPFGSVYATHFLVEARRLGRAVPEDRLTAALDRLEGHLRDGKGGAYEAYVLTLAGRATGPWLAVLAERDLGLEDRARLAAAFVRRGDPAGARALLVGSLDPWALPRESGDDLGSPLRAAALLLEALDDADPRDPRIAPLADRVERAAREPSANTTQENAAALLAIAHHLSREHREAKDLSGTLAVGGRAVALSGPSGACEEAGPTDPWTLAVEVSAPTTLVVRVEGVPAKAVRAAEAHGLALKRTIEGGPGPRRQGRVYRVTLEGTVPDGAAHLLVTDVLPGGFEVEDARDVEGDLGAERVEVRDDRVLFFREKAGPRGPFHVTYRVRAVTPGRFVVPAASAELLYDPSVFARTEGGNVAEIVR